VTRSADSSPELMPEVLVETPDLLVIEKPEGLSSVRLPKGGEKSVVDWLLEHHPDQASIGEKPEDAGAIYRLDRETSGLLLFARTNEALDFYRRLWKTEHVQKTYQALVTNPLLKTLPIPHLISFPIGRSEKSKGKSIAIRSDADLKKIRGSLLGARTKILRTESGESAERLTIQIETGAPHQIRCHLSAIGSPILGDTLYGGQAAPRLYLHCAEISLPDLSDHEKTLVFRSKKSLSLKL
jgi:23S rRNA pseudouridine1911/1915/1917 synthase